MAESEPVSMQRGMIAVSQNEWYGLKAENARLLEDLNTVKRQLAMMKERRMKEDIDARDRIAELEAALRPFSDAADVAEEIRAVKIGTDEIRYPVRMGDLRAARALLAADRERMAEDVSKTLMDIHRDICAGMEREEMSWEDFQAISEKIEALFKQLEPAAPGGGDDRD